MWVEINSYLKRKRPVLQGLLKRCSSAWRLAPSPVFPVLRRIRGDLFWVHPQLLTTETSDAEPHIERWMLDNLPPNGVFFDVGAHYGWLSLKAARKVGRNGRVFAFEASPPLFDILKYHQLRNRLSQLTVVGKAVSDTDRSRAALYLLNGGLSSRNSLTIGRPGLPFLDSLPVTAAFVPTVTLDSFCEAHGLRPDVIKIDVEGAEGLVLRGACRVLRRHRPVLVVSIHSYWLPPLESAERIFASLAACDYHIRDSHVVHLEGYEIGDYLLST